MQAVSREIFDKFKVIDVSKVKKTIDAILSKAEEIVHKYGIKGLLLDPYNKFDHVIPSGMTETNYINVVMTKITDFAKKFHIHIFLVVHPTKQYPVNGVMPKITLYSAAGSANFYNQTDNGFTMMRNRETGIVEVSIEKVRFSEQGKEGWVSFTFNTFTRQYVFQDSKDPVQYQKELLAEQATFDYTENDGYATVIDGETPPF